MSPKRIALVGCGGLGHEIAVRIQSGQAGNYILGGIYTNQKELTAVCADEFGCTPYDSAEMMFDDKPDFMIEAAGGTALKELLEHAIINHIAVIPLSVGVFADNIYYEHIKELAAEYQTHVYIPSGAAGGFDLMSAASLDKDLLVSIQTEKPPRALSDAPFLEHCTLSDDKKQLIFSGNAIEAINAFPQNVNVAVAVGLAVTGTDTLPVNIISNPELNANRHTIELDGEIGHIKIQIFAKPSANAHSSKLASYSVIGLLQRLEAWVSFI